MGSVKNAVIELPDGPPNGAIGYVTILDAIISAIRSGAARPGERLPTQRELAQRFGVAVGTVTRSYAEATRLGLVHSTVGRGTFVAAQQPIDALPRTRPLQCFDLTISRPPPDGCNPELVRALGQIHRRADLSDLLLHQPIAGRQEHRVAGAMLIARSGLRVEVDNVVVCNGVQHGLAAVLGARASPGDLVVTECLNYPGIRLATKLYRLRLQGLAIDNEGLIPEALDAACRRDRPKFLFCTPTLHNPTSAVMSRERRKEIGAIAERHALTVIEDDICGLMPEKPLPPIASIIPERTYYLTGLSKCLSAGIRLGYIAAPTGLVDEVTSAVQATTWIASPLVAAVVTAWVKENAVDRILAWNRSEAKARQKLASEILGSFRYDSHLASFHLWLHLPEPWRQIEFEVQARKCGLIFPSSESFAIGRGHNTHSVRVGFGGISDRKALACGLERLAGLIARGPQFEPVSV
jgi:DNA-binding transcriptional MocR family regulator